MLDLNFNFKIEGAVRIARAVEPFRLMWLEVDMHDARSVAEVSRRSPVPICSGENLFTMRQYRPYFELRAMDVAMVDVPWNGFAPSNKIADRAESYDINIAPHNYYSHLSTFISAHLCAVSPNVRIMETDVDDVPWKDEIVTHTPRIEAGHFILPDRPGWGTDLVEEAVKKHPWP